MEQIVVYKLYGNDMAIFVPTLHLKLILAAKKKIVLS